MATREATKGPEAFRTISEASSELGVPPHVLRFWETKFSFIRPMKRAGGRRFYRRQDLQVLKGVRALLQEGGYTIKGVQLLHKEGGVRHLIGAGEGDMPPRTAIGAADAEDDAAAALDPDLGPEEVEAEPSAQGFDAPIVAEDPLEAPPLPVEPQRRVTFDEDGDGGRGILASPARARLVGVLRDLERVKAAVDHLLSESDA